MASLPLVAATLVVQASQRGQHPQEQVVGLIPSFCRGSVVAFVESKQTMCGRCFRGNAPETGHHTRAEGLVQMGELSAGRQALEGASLAPGNRQTLDALQDPQRRLFEPRVPIPRVLLDFIPEMPFDLDETKFASNVRSAR